MRRIVVFLWLIALPAFAATIKLYLTDGGFHLVREYQVVGDRVRYYSVERSDWEEIPAKLVDLKRTEAENQSRQEAIKKEAEASAAEDKFEAEQRKERENVPQEPGVYASDPAGPKALKQAESKVVTNKSRSVLKVMAPIPVVSGKATVEIQGEHSTNIVNKNVQEFFIRYNQEEEFDLVKLWPKKDARIVQKWTIVPVTKEVVEDIQKLEVFRAQLEEGLYKVWPVKPLEPGEYAIIQFTQGKGNVQVWDFSYRPAAKQPAAK